ncbi:CRISPR-associated RAMP protein, Csm4 family [Caldithrix abyssi DSM 13497]|uniref:CRISPR system Cms protein Csm4 n=1 Tax=Caldithrix abyssi DSM 13497 TaxID=880073 RepID=H1XX18_CALAY|nr:type III-A CRISPR-associated RAMP protein Csm4 [Caldithrix abyssi]APF19578.1 CRISPR-associated protein, Csm4 family [Caldithrix abyssi DSM 13497]EHO39705.1 CRISPR-associated RAMP protein, Csm4 family [Caldithrix abyssi DSM 13497]
MNYAIFRLTFETPLRIGEEGIGAEKLVPYVPSDTLWGALVSAHFTLGLPFDFDDLPFYLSSAFPFFKERLFFPPPLGALDYLLDGLDETQPGRLKDLKKIKYVDQKLFEALINGRQPALKELHFYATQREFLTLEEIDGLQKGPLFGIYERPRVTVDRFTGSGAEGQIFYFSQMTFAKGAGLFFLAEFKDERARRHFEAALRLLADEGLGSDRTVGRGFFRFESAEMELDAPQQSAFFTTLSLYFPQPTEVEELLESGARFKLARRKGYAAHFQARGKRLGQTLMFGEGSLFKRPAGAMRFPGTNPVVLQKDALPDVPFNVYRYGRAFDIPTIIAKEAP